MPAAGSGSVRFSVKLCYWWQRRRDAGRLPLSTCVSSLSAGGPFPPVLYIAQLFKFPAPHRSPTNLFVKPTHTWFIFPNEKGTKKEMKNAKIFRYHYIYNQKNVNKLN